MNRNVDFGIKGINIKPVAGINRFFAAQIDMGGVFMYLRAGLKLFDELFLMFEIQLDAFLNVFVLQNLVNIFGAA